MSTLPFTALTLPTWLEVRLGLELAELLASPVLEGKDLPGGDGQPVMLLPGFLLGDDSLGVMTGWLVRTGHTTSSAGIPLNADWSGAALDRLTDRLERFAAREGRRVAIVGQSLGGLYARVLAVRRPETVSGIVALGSPFAAPAAVHPLLIAQALGVAWMNALTMPELVLGGLLRPDLGEKLVAALTAPFPATVGFESIYSRSDGIVDWRACFDRAAEHREIDSSHYGMNVNVHAYKAIAEALERFRDRERGAPRRT